VCSFVLCVLSVLLLFFRWKLLYFWLILYVYVSVVVVLQFNVLPLNSDIRQESVYMCVCACVRVCVCVRAHAHVLVCVEGGGVCI